jgi:alpha-tubulin suppressor-like RCC1 family protein
MGKSLLSQFLQFKIMLILLLAGCNEANVIKLSSSNKVVPGFSIANLRVNEGSNLFFEVKLQKPLATESSVEFSTEDETALSGTHFTSSSGSLVFAPGEVSKTITVNTISDSSEICAPDRKLKIKLTNSVGSPIATPIATGIIVDPDLPVLSIDDVSLTEGSVASLTASLSATCLTKNVSFRWKTNSGTASVASDFTAEDKSSTIPAGSLTVPLLVTTADDIIYEPSEVLNVSLSSATNAALGTANGTVTLLDNDSIPQANFTVTTQSFGEFIGTTTVTISLSNPSSVDTTVPFTISGTATGGAGNDYLIPASPVVIPAGTTSKSFNITVNDDTVSEVSETVILTMGTPTNGTKGSSDTYTLTITDNEIPKITNVTSPLANGVITSGNVDITVVFSTNVDVVGTPLLNLNTNPARFATYLSGSGTNTLTFRFIIQYDDSSPKLDYAATGALSLAGGTIKDSVNTTNADLTLKAPGAIGSLAANKNLVIAALTIPKVISITMPPAGLYKKDDLPEIRIKFSQPVVVTDYPWLSTKLGAWDDWAEYVSGSGTDTLVFQRLIYHGDYGAGLELRSPIELDTDPIKSVDGVNAKLTFTPPPAIPGFLVDADIHFVKFDTTVASHPELGSTGKQVTISIENPAFEDVTMPVLTSGNATHNVDYKVFETSITIPAGQKTATIHYDIYDDGDDETNESFIIQVERTTLTKNFGLSDKYAVKVEIYDDDGVKDKWRAFSSSENHSCGILNSGILKCWGLNTKGQLGDNTIVNKDSPVTIDPGTSYQEIQTGSFHSCGITNTGALKCWGENGKGQLGIGNNISKSLPTVVDAGTMYIQISTFDEHTCGVTSDNILKCWGDNTDSAIGDGTTTSRNSPTVIDSGVPYLSVAAGFNHTCAITIANVLKCWGNNNRFQSGINGMSVIPSPEIVDTGESYKLVTSSTEYSCGILTSGVFKCWGADRNGNLGGFAPTDTLPIVMDPGTTYIFADLGDEYTCGVTTTNKLKCWGATNAGLSSAYYKFSDPEIIQPSTSFKSVSVGLSFYCATTITNDLKCWGRNLSGSQGFPSTAIEKLPQVINPTASYKSIDSAGGNTCIVTSTNSLFCWGYESLPDGLYEGLRYMPILIDPGISFKEIEYSKYHGCGITTSDKLRCWGFAVSQILNDWSPFPMPFDTGTSYSSISGGSSHMCGISTTGVLKCWGQNYLYQLGTGDNLDIDEQVEILSGTNFISVSAGSYHTCAVTSANKLKCWGTNWNYQIGDGTTNDQPSPIDIDSGSNYLMVSAGQDSTCAITTSNQLKCWGRNFAGVIGDGTSTDRPAPVAVDSGTTYKYVEVSEFSACGITTSNVLKCWGGSFFAEGGVGSITTVLSPQVVDPGVNYIDVTVGERHTCGTTDTGVFKCWGANQLGVFGNKFGFMEPITIGPY